MQRSITIELRIDYNDEGKKIKVQQLAAHCARMLLGGARLLSDGKQEPQIVVFSDDFYRGIEEINHLDGMTAEANATMECIGASVVEATGEEPVSEELLAMAREADAKRSTRISPLQTSVEMAQPIHNVKK